MSTRLDGGGERREFFLSAHRCPEVDLLPHHDSETEIPPPCSRIPSVKIPEFTCTGQSEANYIDVSSCPEEEEESISDWSEEDLSLHFSPSVILPSGDEDSDPESGFECVDITMEILMKGQEGEGLKMVPKRQIQLKKKKDTENVINKEQTEKLQVILKDEPADGRASHSEKSTDELLHPIIHHRPDLLLRQHSMPASLHTPSTTSSNFRVYRAPVAGVSQGVHVGANSRQRLQKSFSLDETKTKMASCIIKSVLSKKMQVEQDNSKTFHLHKKPAVLPVLLQSADQRRVREGEEDKSAGGVFKAPVHVVRDMRSLVKNTYSLSFSTIPTATPDNNKLTSFKVIGQEESPPPTYQQAVGVKAPYETKKNDQSSACNRSSGGSGSLSQSRDRKQSNKFICPIIQQRRGSEPIINRGKVEDAKTDPPTNSPANHENHESSELNQKERTRGVTEQVGTSVPLSVVIQAPPQPSSTSRHNTVPQPLLSTLEQSSNLGVSSQLAPSSSQQILHSCFYTPTALPAFAPTLSHHTGRVTYVQSPMSYIQTQLQPPPPVPTFHLLSRSEEDQRRSSGKTSDQSVNLRTTGDQESDGTEIPPTQKHQAQLQQQFHGFLPAQVGNDSFADMTGSAAAPAPPLSKPGPSHVMLDPKCGRCFYVDLPPQPHRKMLLDPETGQYVQVFLPGTCFPSNTSMLRCVTPASFTPPMINATPTVLSVMQFQPMVAVSSLYAPPCLPLTIHTPSVNITHTTP